MKSTLYYGGDIITLENETIAEAVFVENGMIQAVGSLKELEKLKTKDTKIVNLEEKTMLPSFIDAHSHITAYAATLAYVNLKDVKSFDKLKETLLAFKEKAQLKDDDWLIGFGYDHNYFKEKRHPDKMILDNFQISNPILISHASGHMGVLNSKGLQLFGINQDSKNPDGGRIGRIENTNEPNGYLEEKAFIGLKEKMPSINKEKKIELMEKAQKIYASYGITTIQDGLTGRKELQMLKESNLFLDIVAYIDVNKNPELLQENKEILNCYKNHLRIGGMKLICDGSPQGKTAWLTKPYENSNDSGYAVYSDEQVTKFFEKALQENIQILVHCNGDAAAEQFIRCYKKAKETVNLNNAIRPVMIHAQLLRTDMLEQIKKLQIIPSYFVAHTYFWGDVHIKNLGKRAYSISPAHSSEQLNICYTFHEDSPVIEPDMFQTIWCAVNRITKEGKTIGEQEKVTPLQALKAVTIHAAYQYFEENKKGSIAKGKNADFIIVSENPLKIDPMKIKEIQVLKTIANDKVVFSRL